MKMMQEKERCFDDCDCKEEKKYYYDDCCEPKKYYCEKECRPKKRCYEECYVVKKPCSCAPEPGKALLKCGRGAAGPLPLLDVGTLLGLSNAIPVGSVTIDTRELCNPTILINVNSILAAPVAIATTLTFTVFKCCDGCKQPVGESFTFSALLAALSSQSFSFQICDCANCCGCVTYSLEITNATLVAAGLTVNSQITALAVENNGNSSSCC